MVYKYSITSTRTQPFIKNGQDINRRSLQGTRELFGQTFKNIADTLHKDIGCSRELDYTEQVKWMLFLLNKIGPKVCSRVETTNIRHALYKNILANKLFD